MSGPLMILVAGPYRSGTDGDPARIQANFYAMTRAALALHRLGHLPVLGADRMVVTACRLAKTVFASIDEVPAP